MNTLITLWQYDFFRSAFIAGAIIAVVSAIVGYFVLIRNLSFTSHALTHIGISGASMALLLAMPAMLGQLLISVIAACCLVILDKKYKKQDTIISLILSFSLGCAALFFYLAKRYAGQANTILFGNIFSVSHQQFITLTISALSTLLILGFVCKPLLFASLETELAAARGIPQQLLGIIFIIILAITITLTSQIVGILLVFTLLIGPAAIAMQYTNKFWTCILLSCCIGLATTIASIILSAISNFPVTFWVSSIIFAAYLLGEGKLFYNKKFK